ncbi:hypothetical protein NQ315_010814 [Exocentrus adspersus]|uniref:Ionotropic glutamate receptor C-terminal domain-containing protein n=1 Tax=Exocentrus adspersus TaxID=1586481 RepID=A0AAV8VA57_9CUCU|nr:hypothetical protein NQ315_010814 [Exocentrus adspersus]
MLLKSSVLSFLLFFKFSFEKEITNIITDFVKQERSPTKITAYVCWPASITLGLLKELSANCYYSQARSVKSELQYPQIEEHHMFLLDAACEGSKNIFLQALELNLFNQPFRWLIWGTSNNSIFDNVYLGVDSKVYVIRKNDLHYEIISVYKYAENYTAFVENHVAIWTTSQGFLHFNEVSTPKNRTDLMGTALRIAYVVTNNDTLNHLWDYRYREIDSMSKVNWIVVHRLLEFVNATSIQTFRNTWGYRNATTHQYTGIIGDMQRGDAELGGSSFFFTIDRIGIVDYIATTTQSYMKFIFRAPPLTYVTNVFTLPFDTYVWYCSFALVGIVLVVLYGIVMWEWKDPVFKEKIKNLQSLRPNILDVFLFEIGAVTQQGVDAEPRSSAGRIATIFTFLALMFLYTSYSANIVALLQSTTDSIRTLEDLLVSRIALGVEDIVYAHYYFENAQEPIRKTIYEQKIAPKGQKPNFMTALEGIKRVQQGSFAFHIELSTGYKLVNEIFQENEKCSLKEIEYINLIPPWLAVRKNSTYKEIFKVGLKKIHEAGIQHRENSKIYTKRPVCHTKGSNFGSVGLIDCYAAFLIFGIGLGCSVILMILEKLVKIYHDNKLHQNIVVMAAQNKFFEDEFICK